MSSPPSLVRRSAVILVGGRSSRMGAPKALVELAGKPLLAWIARTLATRCDELVLAAAYQVDQRLLRALLDCVRVMLRTPAQPLRVVHDARADAGPVAGLAAGLAAARAPLAFVSSCDTPLLREAMVEALFAVAEQDSATPVDVVLPSAAGRLEPLVAVYRTSTMARHFAAQLASGGGSPSAHLAGLQVRKLGPADLLPIDPDGRSFLNVNSPQDLAAVEALLGDEAIQQPGRTSES